MTHHRAAPTPHRDFKPGELMETANAIKAYYRKKFDPEGKRRRRPFRFVKQPPEPLPR